MGCTKSRWVFPVVFRKREVVCSLSNLIARCPVACQWVNKHYHLQKNAESTRAAKWRTYSCATWAHDTLAVLKLTFLINAVSYAGHEQDGKEWHATVGLGHFHIFHSPSPPTHDVHICCSRVFHHFCETSNLISSTSCALSGIKNCTVDWSIKTTCSAIRNRAKRFHKGRVFPTKLANGAEQQASNLETRLEVRRTQTTDIISTNLDRSASPRWL